MYLKTEHQGTGRKKLIELQGKMDEATITEGNFNTMYQKWTAPAYGKSVRT